MARGHLISNVDDMSSDAVDSVADTKAIT